MRVLTELDYLNGLPLEKDDNQGNTNQDNTDNSQSNTALAIQKELSKNVGDLVHEMPSDEEESNGGYINTDHSDLVNNTNESAADTNDNLNRSYKSA